MAFTAHEPRPFDSGGAVSIMVASAALAMPMLLAFNLPPSSTFLNQAAALIGWGGWLTLLAASLLRSREWPGGSGLAALQGVFTCCCCRPWPRRSGPASRGRSPSRARG